MLFNVRPYSSDCFTLGTHILKVSEFNPSKTRPNGKMLMRSKSNAEIPLPHTARKMIEIN